MTTIQVNSAPVHDIIIELAKAFDIDYEHHLYEYQLTLPKHLGQGFIKAHTLANGFGIIEYDVTFFKDVQLQFLGDATLPIKFVYVRRGKLDHLFENDEQLHEIEEYQSAIIASSDSKGHMLNFNANTCVATFSVEVDRERFDLSEVYRKSKQKSKLSRLLCELNRSRSFYYKGNYSLKIAEIFGAIKKNNPIVSTDRLMYKFYLESIAYQTLILHLSQYLDDQSGSSQQRILRKREFEQLKKAVNHINKNIEHYKGIDELIEITRLNPIKLQKGFKLLFNKTVNQYVRDKRLEKACEYMKKNEKSIHQIVRAIGLKSASYFSKIFKQRYGVSPSLFLRRDTHELYERWI